MRNFILDLPYKPLRLANRAMARLFHVRLIRDAALYPWQITELPERSYVAGTLPEGAEDYLQADNPRLKQLKEAYAAFEERATRPAEVWVDGVVYDEELLYFRGQNPYVWQMHGLGAAEFRYALSYYALKSSPAADLLEQLHEDGLFGVHTVEVDGRPVSRDLLDSVREIDFIRTHLGIEAGMRILDIGAGYGRLVHRLHEAAGDRVRAFATDAFAPSTFISEYHLRFRGLPQDTVVPLTDVEAFLAKDRVDLAINIHSFSECTADAIDWWVSTLGKHGVPHLLVIPNHSDDASGACLTNRREDMDEIFARNGYLLQVREPRFPDPIVSRNGIDPSNISLFRLDG
jgi:hypothetical protein